jgi:hypothetical protein
MAWGHERPVLVGIIISKDYNIRACPHNPLRGPDIVAQCQLDQLVDQDRVLDHVDKELTHATQEGGIEEGVAAKGGDGLLSLVSSYDLGDGAQDVVCLGIGRKVGLQVLWSFDGSLNRGWGTLRPERPDHAPFVAEQPFLPVDVSTLFRLHELRFWQTLSIPSHLLNWK